MTSTFRPASRIPSDEQIQEDFERCRIHRAIRKGDSQRLLSAINKGANIHLYDHEQLFTFLHLVVIMANPNTEDKFLPMIYILSNYGIEINAQDWRGRTALELAIHKELRHIMVALIRVGTDLTDRDYKSIIHHIDGQYQPEMLDYFEKYEPGLWGAVKRSNVGQVQLLLNSWCRVNIVKNNYTLINYATLTRKSEDLISVLTDSEVSLEFVHATLAGDERMMLELLGKEGCDPHTMDISHQENGTDSLIPRSLRDTVLAMGHTHVLHLLPDSDDASDALEHHLDDDDLYADNASYSYYSEPAAEPTNDTHPSRLCLDLSKLELDHNESEKDQYLSECDPDSIQHRQREGADIHGVTKTSKKHKHRLHQSSDRIKGKKQDSSHTTDEGYNSTVSSVQSAGPAPSDAQAMCFQMGYGHYKKYYDNCYYYTSAPADEADDCGAMMVLTTPRGAQSARSPSKPGKPSSVKAKAKKQRARIYWHEENSEGDAVPVAKGRKSKRSRSMRLSRKYAQADDDPDVKSRMCVIS